MKRREYSWKSRSMARTMNLLVFGEGGIRVFAFPVRLTSYRAYEKHRVVSTLSGLIAAGELELYCIDATDDTDYSRAQRPIAFELFERYVLDELLPFSEKMNPGAPMAGFGICQGAFHAVNLAFRHPGLFTKLVAFSGRYDLGLNEPGHPALFPGKSSPRVFANTPNKYIPGISNPVVLRHLREMSILLGCGENDPFYASNLFLRHILIKLGLSIEFFTWSGFPRRGLCWRNLALHSFAPKTKLIEDINHWNRPEEGTPPPQEKATKF